MNNDAVTAVGAIASIISATGVLGGGLLSFILARRRARRERDERWRLEAYPPDDARSRVRAARIVYLHVVPSYRVLTLRVLAPEGAELRYRDRTGREVGFDATIAVDDDMRPDGHGREATAYTALSIDVRPSSSTPERSALRIAAEVEERSATRRKSRIVMTSQQIVWTQNSTAAKA